jgi:hypothetical protein
MILPLRFFFGSLAFLPSLWLFKGDFKVIQMGTELGLWYSVGFMAKRLDHSLLSSLGVAQFLLTAILIDSQVKS